MVEIRSHLSRDLSIDIWLKKECNQVTGSFKERSARYMLMTLRDDFKQKGVFAATCGNFGESLSYCASQLNILMTIIMPLSVPLIHIQKCRKYNANVIVQGNDLIEAKLIAKKLAREAETLCLNTDDYNAIAANGTVGLEIYDQVGDIDAVIVPVGTGSLIAGVATAIKGLNSNVQIIGVQTEKSISFTLSKEKGQIIPVKPELSIAQCIVTDIVGKNAFVTAQPLVDKMVVVSEEAIAAAMLRIFEADKCVVEGAAASSVAALMSGQLGSHLRHKRVVVVLTGGNIDVVMFTRCLQLGLIEENRIIPVLVTIQDRPGSSAELFRQLATIGVSIRNIITRRDIHSDDVYNVELELQCEVRDEEHGVELYRLLKERYPKNVKFVESGPLFTNLEQISPMQPELIPQSNNPLVNELGSMNKDAVTSLRGLQREILLDKNYQSCSTAGNLQAYPHLGDSNKR
ncbi:L-threonine dehydratase catabolic TdcB-like [Chrysoperla carnea]|uniref:L-threonine dehydratase catabolic TdcB-like n=1 Tax=Chrysoperla carnea TaxID=189513 RepID=UPI001D061874|nr:L-threonine dehydratase catabolic TdcB-like [Chrysoperla carnea]